MSKNEIQEFLEKVYAEPDTDDTLDLILDFVGNLTVWERDFNDCMEMYGGPRILEEPANVPNHDALADMFDMVEVSRLNSTEMVSFLCATLSFRHNFPERDAFVERAKNQLRKNGLGYLDVLSLFKNLI